MIILDASAALELILDSSAAAAVREKILANGGRLAAPHLLDVEVAQVLRRYHRGGEISDQRARMALADLADLPLTRYPHTPFLDRIWELRENLTGYDAAYVALAEALAMPLLTCDAKLASAPRHGARIELIAS